MNCRTLWTPKRQIEITSRRSGNVFRGTLAEDYDGIGQYVLVALAGSSVGSAYRARVAVGDFGGDRVIPRGTRVVVHSHHGQLEVFLGNVPRGCSCGDPFNREVAVGLGTGPLGTYTYPSGSPESSFLVTDGQAEIDMTTALQHARITPSAPIQLPLEVLFTIGVRSDSNPFVGWSGSGTAGRDDFELFAQVNSSSGNTEVSAFCSGTFPATLIGFGQRDDRNELAPIDQDFDDVLNTFQASNPVNQFYFRFYVDSFGVYGRLWTRTDSEPLVMLTDPLLEVWEIPNNVLMPYHAFPANQAAWAATGGGKEQPWTTYRTNLGGYAESITSFTFGSNGVAGTDPKLIIEDICIISGGWC